jgi:hypothetical protein
MMLPMILHPFGRSGRTDGVMGFRVAQGSDASRQPASGFGPSADALCHDRDLAEGQARCTGCLSCKPLATVKSAETKAFWPIRERVI